MLIQSLTKIEEVEPESHLKQKKKEIAYQTKHFFFRSS
jgi:hypothetical protein